MSAAREAVLASARAALGPAPTVREPPREYLRAGTLGDRGDPAAVLRFCERVAEYRADVRTVRTDELAGALTAACARRGARRIAVPADAPPWTLDGVELIRDDPPLTTRELDALDGVLSGCALAIADTGTIVLDARGASGRRALTLVPDYHLCVVRADDVVPSVPDAVKALAEMAAAGLPITLISGPSATSDIELERVEGVHGPRTLDVFVVED
jgi:L-lactate dehydrogenase complex protein LldG